MGRNTLLISFMLLVAAGSAMAGSPSSPEIADDPDDMTSQYWLHAKALDDGPEDLTPSQLSAINASADLLGAWVHGESEDLFMITVQVAELPDTENVSGPLVDVSAFFTIGTERYEARTELSVPAETKDLQASFTLFSEGSQVAALAGNVENETDRLTLIVPKDAVGNPGFGDTLTEFYLTSSLADGGFILDYAPGQPKVNPLTGDLADPGLGPSPEHGQTYEFGQYEGAVSPAIQATATPSSLMIQAGQTGQVSIQVANQAEQADTVTLAVADRPTGWTVELEETQVALDPGQSELITLTVGTPSDASGQAILALSLVSAPLGADHKLPISVQVQPASTQGGQTGGTNGQGTAGGGQTDSGQDSGPSTGTGGQATDQGSQQADDGQAGEGGEEENGAPFAPVALIVAAVAIAAVATRTRRG